ncbi:DUF4239 domain-containing protein [Amnibacterium flavum]|uniref:DUF4239 domain-containing protein n=1 Tax=Amnibacterium flavum TaxID=2173173 RepID=A0A2V1HSJ7_9MICO|nr:DUF4239 domain-containing protein [Amnibacterium flavum]PVZ95575.1 hypothetical protein DDQ50_03510 [Amnibacterium flavum]
MGDFLYQWPIWLSLPIFVAGFLLVSWGVLLVLRGPVRRAAVDSLEWDRVLGYAITAYGVFYGILLALVAVSVYENFMRVDEAVLAETSAIATLFRDVSGYPDPIAGQLMDALRSYTEGVVTIDFPAQALGRVPTEDDMRVLGLQDLLLSFEPTTPGMQVLHNNTIAAFNDLILARRTRVDMTHLALPSLFWVVIGIGALLNAVLLGLIEVKRVRVHLFMSGVIAVFVGLLIFVTADMDHPYSGEVAVTSEDYQDLLDDLLD